jgi:DNA-binding CsgD family transcriptional regulator
VPKSARVGAADVRTVFQLVGECRDLGDDPVRWWRHFAAVLARTTGAGIGLVGEIGVYGPRDRRDLGITDWGIDENGFDRAGWVQMLTAFRHDPLYNPIVNAYVARLPRNLGAALSRTDMIADRDWYPSGHYQGPHRALGADAVLTCYRPVPGVAGAFSEVYLLRRVGERDFSPRDRAVAREAMAAVASLVGGPLARFADPSPADLSPRAREVLRCLLEGDGDKQIAARLGLSTHTVNQYSKVVFRHFRVRGRAELLARWVRRGWGGRFAWTDPPKPRGSG